MSEQPATRVPFVVSKDEVVHRAKASASYALLVGRFDSRCGACGKAASPHDKAHTTPVGYTPEPGCGAVWTHVVSTYADPASEQATRNLRPDLIFGNTSAPPANDEGHARG